MKNQSKHRFYSLWAINGALDQSELRRQLNGFRYAGLDGVVWHPRFYPNDPPYLSERYFTEVSDAIVHAKSIGLAFWIYDEDGWPSGTVGGQLLKRFPQVTQRWAELVIEKPEHCLAEFERDGKKWFVAERVGAGVDYLTPELAKHFVQLTHERYRDGLKPEAWRHVEAIFCDEPEFGLGHAYNSLSSHGAIPWTPRLPQIFRERHGEDLMPLLAQLFFPGENSSGVRVKFWELLADVFNESFTAPINQWCEQHGKLFTAHVKGEEHPYFQVPTSGSCHQFFQNLSLPGIDALERFPGNHFYPRQVWSAAQQFGTGRCMAEAFGGAGWGATPEDLERFLLWLGGHGVTDFVLHLSQYQLDSAAICDWPPSQPLHLNWVAAYPHLLRRVRETLQKNPPAPAEVLMVAPYRGIMAGYEPKEFLQTNIHNAATYPDSFTANLNRRFLEQIQRLHDAGISYHVVDERTLETYGAHDSGGVRVGKCVYRKVIVAEGVQLSKHGRNLLETTGRPFAEEVHISVPGAKMMEEPVAVESISVEWSLSLGVVNALLLEPALERDGWFVCEFTRQKGFPLHGTLEVFFADTIRELTFNGRKVGLFKSEHGTIARLTQLGVEPVNALRFCCEGKANSPFVWLQGEFRAVSLASFAAGPNGTVATSGPFALAPLEGTLKGDLVQAGFPFLRSALVAQTTFTTTRPATSLQLCGVKADAARLVLNGQDTGWAWGPRWGISGLVKAGMHSLQLELIPNAFNYFGPHHYFGGDWNIISPDQFTGKRNFADPADAPANTLVKAWHFRPFQFPESISLLQ